MYIESEESEINHEESEIERELSWLVSPVCWCIVHRSKKRESYIDIVRKKHEDIEMKHKQSCNVSPVCLRRYNKRDTNTQREECERTNDESEDRK